MYSLIPRQIGHLDVPDAGGHVKYRIVSLISALGLVALFIPATAGQVAAWSAQNVAYACSNDAAVHNWTVTLTAQPDFNIQWADNAGFVGATDVLMHVGANALQTPATVTTLYVRWASDPSSESSATWNGGTCDTQPTPTPTPTPTATEQPTVRLTFIKMICPSYTVVPANKNPTVDDATGGHGAQLDTSYQTSIVNPATDLPAACHRADGWQFQMYGAFTNGILSPTVGAAVTTGADGVGTGSVTITLNSTEVALAQTSGSPTGLWVAEVMQPSVAGFGALRCFTDIGNGDNVESIHAITANDTHLYCIAYNVAPSTDATPTPVATPTPFESFQGETATPQSSSTPTPFESFQGETATPKSSTTPPPTSTNGGNSGESNTPLGALLILIGFGALGLVAVESQRRTSRR